MTREEKINTLTAIIQECEEYQWQRKETLFEIIKDLEQEPCEDAISYEDAISREDALMALTGEWTESRDEILSKSIGRIKALPSVTVLKGR